MVAIDVAAAGVSVEAEGANAGAITPTRWNAFARIGAGEARLLGLLCQASATLTDQLAGTRRVVAAVLPIIGGEIEPDVFDLRSRAI